MAKLSLVVVLLLATVAAAQTKSPVLVELFTSEGCSSCPPADQLLIHLDNDQPVSGAYVIVLGEHVDYWDSLGWRDRFSSSRFTARQEAYAERFRINGPYTPQMVVNGASEFVGNDPGAAVAAIKKAAATRDAAAITLQRNGEQVHVAIDGAGPRPLDVFYALTERDLTTKVGGGENHGRELHHTAVVRELRRLGSTSGGRFDSNIPLHLAAGWRPENLRAVVFVQYGPAGEILAAAQIGLK